MLGDEDQNVALNEPLFGSNNNNNSQTAERSSTKATCLKSRRNRRILSCVFSLVFLCGAMVPVVLFVIVPKFAQGMLDDSEILLMNATMLNPTNNTIDMNTFLEMSTPDMGFVDALVKSSTVKVGTANGIFGYLQLPQIQVDSSQLWVNVTSTLYVTNVQLFTEATASVLQGHPQPWIIEGTPSVHITLGPSKLHYPLTLRKQFALPTTLFVQMSAANITIVESTPSKVVSTATSSFFSSSVLEMHAIGEMVFNLTDLNGVFLGEAVVPDFHALRDFNVLDNCRVEMMLLEDGSNLEPLRSTVRTFLSGANQQVVMKGPVRSVAPFFSNIVSQSITLTGTSLISNAEAYNLTLSAPTNTTSAGALVTVGNARIYSGMALSLQALGSSSQRLHLMGGEKGNVVMGFVELDRDVHVGLNNVPDTRTTLSCAANDTNDPEACKRAVKEFLTVFTQGLSQTVRLRGPFGSVTPFMDNTIDTQISVQGSKLMKSVVASNFAIVETNATHVWTTCTVSFVSDAPVNMLAVGGLLVFEMKNSDGVVLAHSFLEQDVVAGANTINNMRTLLAVQETNGTSNVAAINAFLRTLSLGQTQTLTMAGPVSGGETTSPLLFNTMSEPVQAVGSVLMSNVVCDHIVTTGGSSTQLFASSTTSFIGGMSVPKGAAGGPLAFEMVGDGGEVLGNVVVDEAVVIGMNVVDSLCTMTKSDTNQNALNTFFSHFLSVEDQVVTISGPVQPVNPILSRIFSTTSVVKAQTDPLVYYAIMDEQSLNGNSAGQRGSKVTLLNPFPVAIRMSNMNANMYMHTPIAFDFKWLLQSHKCDQETQEFTIQITAKGMDPNDANKDYVDLQPLTTTKFFSPAVPFAAQKAGVMCKVPLLVDLPCCFLATPIAASCRASQNQATHVELFANGTYSAVIAGFSVDVSFKQENVTAVFDPTILSGFVGDGELGCSSITLKS